MLSYKPSSIALQTIKSMKVANAGGRRFQQIKLILRQRKTYDILLFHNSSLLLIQFILNFMLIHYML